MKKTCFTPFLSAVVALFTATSLYGQPLTPIGGQYKFRPLRVAHAGGGINGDTYTNSLQALDLNLGKGFRYFEMDFSFTKDNKLVCLHDWDKYFEKLFGFKAANKMTLNEFEALVKSGKSKYTQCTLATLADWMKKNPSAYLITDVKGENIEALKLIYRSIPDASRRVIPQIYRPTEIQAVKSIGFNQMIWTLYRSPESDELVLALVKKFKGPFAITMPAKRAITNLPKELQKLNIPTYVHTINDVGLQGKFTDNGITEIYTDFLSPKN